MKQGLTASLLVCLAAAGVAVGALALQPEDEPQSQVTATAPSTAPAPGSAGSYGSDADAGEDAPATDAVLVISDFELSALTVAPGATVIVQNEDDFPHTVDDDDGAISSGAIDGGTTGSFVAPTTPGTYELHCNFHPQMSGTLTVR